MMQTNGLNALKVTILVLFLMLLVPIALSFWTVVIGFVVRWRGGDSLELADPQTQPALPDTAAMALYRGGRPRLQRGPRARVRGA